MMKIAQFMTVAMAIGGLGALAPNAAMAQERQLGAVTLDLRDAPIRSTLEAAFKQAGINNYVIDNNVVGFVTLTITDQPFENALKLIMRAASVPLTYTKENQVYIVKPRTVSQNPTISDNPDLSTPTPQANVSFERVQVTYIDPFDLQSALGGFITIRSFQRQGGGGGGMGGGMGGMGGGMGGGMMGGMGGGMGGMGGGMMGGGMGGMGGGMMGGGMGGMGGGMMGGGMGGMGGGMGGGMIGGGRNF